MMEVDKEEYIEMKLENHRLKEENKLLKAGLDSIQSIVKNVRGVVV